MLKPGSKISLLNWEQGKDETIYTKARLQAELCPKVGCMLLSEQSAVPSTELLMK